jgi:hypothetical protein
LHYLQRPSGQRSNVNSAGGKPIVRIPIVEVIDSKSRNGIRDGKRRRDVAEVAMNSAKPFAPTLPYAIAKHAIVGRESQRQYRLAALALMAQ